MSLEIRPLNRTDRDEVRRWTDTVMAAVRMTRPDHEPRGLDATMAELATPLPTFEGHFLVGLVDGVIVGSGEWYLFGSGETDKALVCTYVDPAHRGRGYGRALADAVEASVDRPVLLAEVDYAADWAAERDGRFAAARGFTASEFMTGRQLLWPPDAARLDALERPTPGYVVETWVDGLPDDVIGPFGALYGLVDKDAPSGDVAWTGEPLSPEDYTDELRRELDGGGHRVETVAFVARPDGRRGDAVAFTSVQIPANPKRFLSVDSTYVRRDHRGHGLGLAVKIAIERRLLALDLPHPSLRTGNADDNRWMVGINETLGFEPYLRSAELVKRRG